MTLLIILGIAMIRSTTLTSIDPAVQQYTSRQIIYALVGAAILVVVSAIDYRLWSSIASGIYAVLIGLLLVVEAIGLTTFGATRWIDLGIVRLQPSELGKFLIALTLGHLIASNSDQMGRFNLWSGRRCTWACRFADLYRARPKHLHHLHRHLAGDDVGGRPALAAYCRLCRRRCGDIAAGAPTRPFPA